MAGREKIWVVRAGDGRTLRDILERAGEPPDAIAEGRVFLGKKRAVRADQPVRPGDTVRIGPQKEAPQLRSKIDILFQRDGLVACNKPAGLPTVPDHAGAAHSLVALVAGAIGAKTGDLRVTSRLDRDVSGVVVFALDAAAETRLREARARGAYHRRYVAIACGALDVDQGVWATPVFGPSGGRPRLRRGAQSSALQAVGRSSGGPQVGRAAHPRGRAPHGAEPKDAETRWMRIATPSDAASGSFTMLALEPVTGRTHQIRIHASDAGVPLLGDRDYGGRTSVALADGRILAPSRIALHAARVVVPGLHGIVEACAPIPEDLASIWLALGGEAEAWNRAVSCPLPPASVPRERVMP